MDAVIPGLQLPEHAKVNVKIDVSSEINVTPFIAMQKVNRFLTLKVGNLLRADKPELIIGERLVWRVPVIYSIPAKGKLGKVGEISVDAESGEILVEQMTPKEVMEASAESLLKCASL